MKNTERLKIKFPRSLQTYLIKNNFEFYSDDFLSFIKTDQESRIFMDSLRDLGYQYAVEQFPILKTLNILQFKKG